jgi:hypothetical protein
MMNERIRELVKQADIEFDVSSDNYGVDTATVTPYDLEKFAEDMVRKCSLYLWKNEIEWTAFKEDRLFEHFGIK